MSRKAASYKILVGLEIHVQLATASKMFTAAKNGFGGEPNAQVDPQILGLPGTLPVINKKAVEFSIMTGLALNCQIAPHTKWDRKSYYYPDLPKNYQISQYDMPLCHSGWYEIEGKKVRIRRAHLEEDAGKLMHDAPGGYHIDYSIVDLNRAGTPLLEIVTEPDFDSGKSVAAFGAELQKLVQFLGVSEGQMQMGHMRFEPNINVHITDEAGGVHKTAITEIKNLNSFSVLERATDYEALRQVRQWEETGDLGKKSTYGWDEDRQVTVHQRDKEEANDYRYFPDPDLVPVEVSADWLTELKSKVGELPTARRTRYIESLGLSPADATTLTADRTTGEFYETAIKTGGDPKRISNLLLSHGRRIANEKARPLADIGITPQRFSQVAQLIDNAQITASNAGPLFDKLLEQDTDPALLAKDLGLILSTDTTAIDTAIDALITANPKPLQDFKSGKASALGALTGMIMKSAKGANPQTVQQRLKEKLGA